MKRHALAGAVAACITLSGCGALSGGLYEAPLPGGADLGSHPYTVTAEFDDALDLVPQSSVKVDDVAVGKVTKISLAKDGRGAIVRMQVNGDVVLPAGTTARLRQTSLLGEKYVSFVTPATAQAGAPVGDGDTITRVSTSEAAQVEEVLGALSMVLNGGGIEQFQEISRELTAVSAGRPEEIRGFLEQMNTFVSGLDERKEAITSALDGLAAVSQTLDQDKDKIARALDDLSPGMQVLVDQREDLVDMLEALDRLSEVSVETLDAAQDDIVADLLRLEPILDQLARSGKDLPNSLQILLTYPFPDSVLAAIKGDYMNVFITTNFRTPGGVWAQPGGRSAANAAALSWPEGSDEVAPMMLPPTSNAIPAATEPTVTVSTTPTSAPTAEPADPTSDPTTDPTPEPDQPTDDATTAPARAEEED